MFYAAVGSVLIWVGLLLFRAGFWRADQVLDDNPQDVGRWPSIATIIPARNEADTIQRVLAAHAKSDYPGQYSVIVVDDHSDDATAALAEKVKAEANRPVYVISAPDLQPGWSGKLWALNAGLDRLEDLVPDCRYVLLTDADILHPPETARALMAKAIDDDLDLVSLMALLDCRGGWARLLVPAFVFFFQKLYPFPMVNDATSRQAGAAGGCVLLRRDALARIGGISAIREALIDDCALAAAVKGNPPRNRIWLGLSRSVRSLRDNSDLGSIRTMVERTAFTQLRHSTLLLAGCLAGMALTYLAGPVALVWGLLSASPVTAGAGAIAWLLSALAYWPTLRLYGQPISWALTLPAAASMYSMMTLSSALKHWRGKGGHWKGRTYSDLARS
ncbi:MAG: glycosyltransferase [Pseudomonadota bacterium]